MDSDKLPTAYGVFKPVGHVVISFANAADCDAASAEMTSSGFESGDITHYTPEQMIEQVDADLANASPLSGLGQESNLVKAHGDLARQGGHFLVVKSSDQEQTDRLTEIATRHHASRAQHYGRFLIEELIDVGDSDHQVAESTARGLDAQTPSGQEEPNDTAAGAATR